VAEGVVSHGLIIRLVIQTIRRVPSGSVWIDEAPNLSSPDPSGADRIDAEHQATDLAARQRDTGRVRRQPSAATASPVGRVTLTLHGPIGELATALRILAAALDHEQATSTVTYPPGSNPTPVGRRPAG
jgi:hypothetical protein